VSLRSSGACLGEREGIAAEVREQKPWEALDPNYLKTSVKKHLRMIYFRRYNYRLTK